MSSLVRAFAEAKPYLIDDISSGKLNEYDKKVTFYIELKKTIGTASGDFLDLKAYEPDMRKMIDNYIIAIVFIDVPVLPQNSRLWMC